MDRQAWERTRTEVTAIFQIVSEQKLDKHKLMPFDWDNKDTQPAKKTAPSTRERVQELKERLKNNRKKCHPTL